MPSFITWKSVCSLGGFSDVPRRACRRTPYIWACHEPSLNPITTFSSAPQSPLQLGKISSWVQGIRLVGISDEVGAALGQYDYRLRPYLTNRKALILSYEMAKQDDTTMPKMIPFRDSYEIKHPLSSEAKSYTI